MKDEDKLENLISPNGIIKMMNNDGSDKGLEVYEVSKEMAQTCDIDGNILTYLVHYPLADMPLDLQKYMDQAAEAVNSKEEIIIPPIPGEEPLSAGKYYYIYDAGQGWSETDQGKPFLRIPLNDMAKLVKSVTKKSDGKFGLEIDYTPQLANYLELKIPAFDIEYMKGIPSPSANPDKLQFYTDTMNEFVPQTQLDGSDFLIYARISGPCWGNLILGILFDWANAVIDTGAMEEGNFIEEYPIGNSLGNFLGGTVSFNKVEGYVYMSGLGSDSLVQMAVDVGDGPQNRDLKEAEKSFNVIKTKPDGTKIIDGSLDDSSCDHLELAPIFKSAEATIKAQIKIDEFTIHENEAGDRVIKISLYALIPLDLKISGLAPSVTTDNGINIQNNYVPLDLGNRFNLGVDDLFGRKGDKDDIINEIDEVGISLRDIQVSVIDKDKLAVLIKSRTTYKLLEFNKKEPSLTFEKNFISYPFSPDITILLAKDNIADGGKANFGSFKILRTDVPKFDFKLDVKAKAKFNYTIDLTKKE